MKILVTGGRMYGETAWELDLFFRTMDRLHVEDGPIGLIVHGAAKGADSLAEEWAGNNHVTTAPYKANWVKYGRSAGPRRNQEMLKLHPDIEMVVAFPGGKGTADMVRLSLIKGIKVYKPDERK